MVLKVLRNKINKVNINPKGSPNKLSNGYLEKHKTLIILVYSSLIIVTFVVAVVLKLDLVNVVKVNHLEGNLGGVGNITSFEDGTISFSVNGKNINLSMDNNKCKYYTKVDGKIIESSAEEFYNKSLFNALKAAPNSSGNFLYYSVDNYVEDESFQEIKTSSVTSRYIEIPEGYLIEIYNPIYNKGKGLIYFNSNGNLDKESIYEFYADTTLESIQLVLPKTVKVESITESLVNYLNSL